MKKKAFAILTLCISLFAAVALVGCGGSGGATGSGGGGGAEKPAVDMRTDFIWFKVEVPEGVEITDVAGDTADRAQFKFTESEHASDRFIPVFDPDKNADELFDYEAKWNASFEWTENDPVKYNGKTWRNAVYLVRILRKLWPNYQTNSVVHARYGNVSLVSCHKTKKNTPNRCAFLLAVALPLTLHNRY